jgi:hypothetical protein
VSKIGGYLATIDADLRDRIERQDYFTVAIRSAELASDNLAVCFISFDGESIEYAALSDRRRRAVTARNVVRFSDFVELDNIALDEISAYLDPEDRNDVRLPVGGAVRAWPLCTLLPNYALLQPAICVHWRIGYDSPTKLRARKEREAIRLWLGKRMPSAWPCPSLA